MATHIDETRARRVRRPRGEIAAIQRARIIAAALDAVEDIGYERMTVAQVISRARVSRKTFYDVFEDRDQCFLAALDQALAEASALAKQAYAREKCWQDGVRSALATLLDLMDEAPGLAKACVVETLRGGELVLARRARVLAELASVIDAGRASPGGRQPPALTPEAIVGGVLAVLHARLVRPRREPFSALLGELMSMIVLPYLGPAGAKHELNAARPTARAANPEAQTSAAKDPLQGLKMRLTYRTVTVLAAIAGRPGASNREIARGAGIIDQGQISKLLNRLAALGLVENHGVGQRSGGTNAWQLTERGVELERATRPRLTWTPARRMPQST